MNERVDNFPVRHIIASRLLAACKRQMQVNIYLKKNILRRLDEAREEDGFSRSAMIGRLVRRYLRKRDEKLGLLKKGGPRGGGAAAGGK